MGVLYISFAIPGLLRLPLRYRQVAHGALFGLWAFVSYLSTLRPIEVGTFLGSTIFFAISLLYAGQCWKLTQEIRLLDE